MIGDVFLTKNPNYGLVSVLRKDKKNPNNVIAYCFNFKSTRSIPLSSIDELMIPIEQEGSVKIISQRINNLIKSLNIPQYDFFENIEDKKYMKKSKKNKPIELETVEIKLINKICNFYKIPIEDLCCTYKTTKYD